MSLKFNLTYNTPSDWIKAITAGLAAGVTALNAAQVDNVVNTTDVLNISLAVLVAFGTVLGIYSARDHKEVVPADEPYTFQVDNAERAAENPDALPEGTDDSTFPPVA